MDAQQNNLLHESVRSARWTLVTGALLIALTAVVFTPVASAADPVTEVVAGASNAAEPVTTAAPPAAPTPTTSTPPPAPTPPPVAAADPSASTEVVTSTVDRALGTNASGGGSAAAGASQVVHETTQRSAETVNAVAETSGAGKVPIVEGAVRSAGTTADSLATATADVTKVADATKAGDATKTDASAHSSPGPGGGSTVPPAAGPSPANGRIGPSPLAPSPAADLVLSVPWEETRLVNPGNAPAITATIADLQRTTSHPGPAVLDEEVGPSAPAGSPTPSFPPPPVGTAASSSSGGGFGPSLFLLGLLALCGLVAPRTPPRLVSASASYRPAPFICALERPG
jgi:hypothetical protein